MRTFVRIKESPPQKLNLKEWSTVGLTYRCRDCLRSTRVFGVSLYFFGAGQAVACKLGQLPAYGDPLPPKLIELLGSHQAEFMKGRRCEGQGLGLGAFTYYRRVVEAQRDEILDSVIRVGRKAGLDGAKLDALEKAKTETQFARAMDDVRDAIPRSLYVEDKNPFTLLHSALSFGIHQLTDEECLKYAGHLRVVLTALAERLKAALNDDRELSEAVARLDAVRIVSADGSSSSASATPE